MWGIMAKSALRVISPDPITNAHEVIELAAKTFGGYYDFRRTLRDWYLLNSHYDWKASAVGFLGEDLVTHYGVWDYKMRIGKSVVRCGGIGCVATDGEHRKKGLMAQTVPHSLKSMRERGYDFSILFGIWDFYHQFGYTRAWNETSWHMGLDRLPKDLPTLKYKPLPPTPGDTINKLHNRYNATVTGAAVRPTFHKSFCFFKGKTEGFMWKSGRDAGYVLVQVNGAKLSCFEAAGKPDDILSVLQSIAQAKHLRDLSFETLPYNTSWVARATVTVVDERGAPVANAIVLARWYGVIVTGGVYAPTDANGRATITSRSRSRSTTPCGSTTSSIPLLSRHAGISTRPMPGGSRSRRSGTVSLPRQGTSKFFVFF